MRKKKYNLSKIIFEDAKAQDDQAVRELIRGKLSKNPNMTEAKLLTEIFGFLISIGSIFLGLFTSFITSGFSSFSSSSYGSANRSMSDWGDSKGYSSEDIEPGGKHHSEASAVGLKSIIGELSGILTDLSKLDEVDPLPPLDEEKVGDEEKSAEKYKEQMEAISKSSGTAAGNLAGAFDACGRVVDNKKARSYASSISKIKPTCAADVWHIAYASALGIRAIVEKSNKDNSENVPLQNIVDIIEWCASYENKFPGSKTPNWENISDTPSLYADPKLTKASKEVIKGSISLDEIKSWNGTIAHYLPALWAEVTNIKIDEDNLKKLNDKSAEGLVKLVDQLNSLSDGSKISSISKLGTKIIDEVFYTEGGKFVNAEKHLDFMGRDTGHKYFFDPRYGDGWKNRIWGFALALPAEEVRKTALNIILPAAGVPASLSLGNGQQGHHSKSDKTSWKGRTPSIELLMSKIKPIIQGSMWLAMQDGESGQVLSKRIGVVTNGSKLTKIDIVRLFGENPETNGAFAPKETLDEPEKFWPGAFEKHLPGLKPDRSDFMKYILPHLMKKTSDLQLVPNKELWNFILAGDQSGHKEYSSGEYNSLSGMVVESSNRWLKLAGLLKS